MERWLPVPGYEGIYEVSDLGRVRSLPRVDAQGGNRRLRMFNPSRMDAWGHLGVKLRRDGVVRSFYVHRLVLEAFAGPCPAGMEGCHWNDVPDDNRLSNLRWATKSDNQFDAVRNGVHHNARKTHCWRGHPFSADNTAIRGSRRHCQQCQYIYQAAYRARRAQRRLEEKASA